ncbi:MAG: DUF2269 family protein [Burkholderiales bacterium]
MSDALSLWKTAHIMSAAILLGTGFGTAFFCWFGYRSALRTGEIGTLRATLRLTVIADACFIAPAVLFQAVSGVVLMRLLDWPLVSPWSLAAWGLFLLVGACWVPVVAIQLRLSREALRAASVNALPARFHRLFRLWFALGVPAFTAVVTIFYLMVAKPLTIAGT